MEKKECNLQYPLTSFEFSHCFALQVRFLFPQMCKITDHGLSSMSLGQQSSRLYVADTRYGQLLQYTQWGGANKYVYHDTVQPDVNPSRWTRIHRSISSQYVGWGNHCVADNMLYSVIYTRGHARTHAHTQAYNSVASS